MNKIHLNKLIEFGDNDLGYVGTNSLSWGRFVVSDQQVLDLNLNKRFNRYQLFEYCQNKENSNVNVLIAILSWGGMNRKFGISLFNNLNHLLPIVENLRQNKYNNRIVVFSEIQNLRNRKLLPGLGIGYFTKIICFLSPNLKGYIMDQWASKSVNLLMNEKIIKIQNGVWVNDQNDSIVYEKFCNVIDELANILNCDGFEAEKKLFSVGYGKGKWRNYLKENYK
jgi:hypothetical protein